MKFHLGSPPLADHYLKKPAEIAASDYPTYSGDRIATYGDDNSKLTDQEREGMEMLGTLDDTFQPYLDKYEGVADTLGQGYDAATREELLGDPFSMDTAQPFMDIYQDAMNPAVREIEEQTIRAQNEARSRAARGGGAFRITSGHYGRHSGRRGRKGRWRPQSQGRTRRIRLCCWSL